MSDTTGPTGVAILGCGWAGARHARAFAANGATVRWVVDTAAERAAALAGVQAGTRATTDYRVALGDPALEAVSICLPHALHAPVAIEAATAGKHILCEKPIANTLEVADRMIAAADAAGVTLMIAENVHFDPLWARVRDLLHGGAIGHPALLQFAREAYLTDSFLRERPWFLDARLAGGGIMLSGGIHDFELMRLLLGEIVSVYALRPRQRFSEMEGDDTSIALVHFADGSAGTLVGSFIMKSFETASGIEVHTLRIDGDLGSIAVGGDRTIRLFSERPDFLIDGARTRHEIAPPEGDSFTLEIAHFLDAIRTGREPVTSGRLQRRPLEIVLAAYESMATGQPVALP